MTPKSVVSTPIRPCGEEGGAGRELGFGDDGELGQVEGPLRREETWVGHGSVLGERYSHLRQAFVEAQQNLENQCFAYRLKSGPSALY